MPLKLLASLVQEPALEHQEPPRYQALEDAMERAEKMPTIPPDTIHYANSGMAAHVAPAIKDWADANQPFTMSALVTALGVPDGRQRALSKTLGRALGLLNYVNIRKMISGQRYSVWVPADHATNDDTDTTTATHSVGAWIEMQQGPFDLRTAFKGIEGHYSHSDREAVTMDSKLIKIGCGKAITKYGVVYFPPKYKGSI